MKSPGLKISLFTLLNNTSYLGGIAWKTANPNLLHYITILASVSPVGRMTSKSRLQAVDGVNYYYLIIEIIPEVSVTFSPKEFYCF